MPMAARFLKCVITRGEGQVLCVYFFHDFPIHWAEDGIWVGVVLLRGKVVAGKTTRHWRQRDWQVYTGRLYVITDYRYRWKQEIENDFGLLHDT